LTFSSQTDAALRPAVQRSFKLGLGRTADEPVLSPNVVFAFVSLRDPNETLRRLTSFGKNKRAAI